MEIPPIRRRTFLAGAATAATAATTGRAASDRVMARTSAGLIAGQRIGGLSVFKGVPYARPPVGELRFASPQPPQPWSGVRAATRFAPPSYQTILPGSSEDALYANVWTPSTKGCRPVLVYIHGGGWLLGAGSEPNYDGARAAARGDIVVVTFNYRLGIFGFGLHEDLRDGQTGSFANWGIQDQVALLHWVRENAHAFGGDPDNITLSGTSAGGASTYQLALLPQSRPLIRRIVPISACHVWNPANTLSPQDSREAYESIARQLGTTVRGLRAVPPSALQHAWDQLFSGPPQNRPLDTGREYRASVLDGRWMHDFDYRLPGPDLPVLAVYTSTEGSFYTGPGAPVPVQPPVTDADLRVAVRDFLFKGAVRVGDELVDGCITAYRAAAVAEGLPSDPLSIWTEVWGDGLFRYQIVRLAERHAREGGTPQYVMEFAHPTRPPYFGTPHEATSKFLFGTYGLPQNVAQFGDGPLERRISDTFIDLVSSFAHTGTPSSENAPHWPVFDAARPSTLVLGGERVATVAATRKARQLRFWDDAGWVPAPR